MRIFHQETYGKWELSRKGICKLGATSELSKRNREKSQQSNNNIIVRCNFPLNNITVIRISHVLYVRITVILLQLRFS